MLIVDIDPQAHTTLSFGIRNRNGNDHIQAVFLDGRKMQGLIHNTYLEKLHIIPGSKQLSEFEKDNSQKKESRTLLAEKLSPLIGIYDFIIFDTPPTFGLLTVSALIASQEVYVPMQTHYLGFDGLSDLIKLIYAINRLYNPLLKLRGIIPTFYKRRTRIAKSIIEKIQENLGNTIILPPVRVNIALAEAPGYGETIFQYKPESSGASDYLSVADHIIQKGIGI